MGDVHKYFQDLLTPRRVKGGRYKQKLRGTTRVVGAKQLTAYAD